MVAATDLAADRGLSIWDAVVLAASAEAECRLLLSEDLQTGFTWRGVTVVNRSCRRLIRCYRHCYRKPRGNRRQGGWSARADALGDTTSSRRQRISNSFRSLGPRHGPLIRKIQAVPFCKRSCVLLAKSGRVLQLDFPAECLELCEVNRNVATRLLMAGRCLTPVSDIVQLLWLQTPNLKTVS